MIKKVEKKFKKVNSQKGFTLLEILVVLTIMGFLIAMVAPRLAGISGSAVDTVCDSNQNRMVTYVSSFFEKTNRFPSDLTNLVITDGSGGSYYIPEVSDQNPDNDVEVLAKELDDRNHFMIHILTADEADELKNMGIVSVFNLNDYSNTSKTISTEQPFMQPVAPGVDVGVAMVGCGALTSSAVLIADNTTERGWGEPANFARIVLGMGSECGLITSGVISNAAHCPGGIQNADNVTYNDYILLLPRLEATSARIGSAITNITAPTALTCIAYDEIDATDYALSTNSKNYRVREFDITAAQERWQFATMCPEGHMYPADDEEFWGINLDNDAVIGG